MKWVLCLSLSILCALPGSSAGEESVSWLTGKKFDWALDQPVIATWQNAELRVATRALSGQRQVPLVFDRRLDPNHRFSLATHGEPLSEVWSQLARIVDGGVSITGQAVYMGPSHASSKLRTLIALRQEDLQQLNAKLPAGQRKLIADKQTLSWFDLDAPRDIFQRLAEERGIRLKGIELIPHDLWGGTELPAISLAEAATLILIQYDLTFRPTIQGKLLELELIPIPESVVMERKWTLPRAKADAISHAIQTELPGLATQATAEQLVAQGTQEQLEELERLIGSLSSGTVTKKKPPAAAPLSKRRLTFQAKDAPLSSILEKLGETGIRFEYDKAELKRAGIDVDKLVEVDVKDARPEELFEKLFNPLGIAYEIDGLTISLKAAMQ